ncbi:MAG TPA: hypothetical protein VKC89_01735 [Patescibacteria group bacterium]|nr:hypothetical protein [Patescibacteria group bacterium]
MTEREDRRILSTLPVELKVHLGFNEPPEGEWLIHDDFISVGNVELYEWFPARARVLKDGSRYEIGAAREDIEGLLSLAKLLSPQAGGIDKFLAFWGDHKKFSVKEEGELIFIGADIEPTPMGFEYAYDSVYSAYYLALTSAVKNMSYQELKKDAKYKFSIEQTEHPTQRALLFSTLAEEMGHGREPQQDEPEIVITANTLRDFPLETHKTMLAFAPGTLIRDGKTRELTDIDVIGYNGESSIRLWASLQDLRANLPIAEGVEIKTVDDLKKLKKLKLLNDREEVVNEMDVEITVDDDAFKIVSEDKSFELEVRKPVCEDCKIPTWKFPPGPCWIDGKHDPRDTKFSMHSTSSSLGIYRCLVNTEKGQKTYCINCVETLEENYVKDHPFVSKPRATDVVRRKLDEMGNPDVEIWEDQIWRLGKGWEFYTKLEYERNGRKITRYAGKPTLSDGGKFEPNLFSREYIQFRA